MGKSDRAFVFGVIGLIVGLGYSTKTWLDYVLVVMLVLLCVTVFNRARRALMEVQ
jgi:CDP-diacylglycerol--glycerol-3-phosphate 3-phosphatidyltransferase